MKGPLPVIGWLVIGFACGIVANDYLWLCFVSLFLCALIGIKYASASTLAATIMVCFTAGLLYAKTAESNWQKTVVWTELLSGKMIWAEIADYPTIKKKEIRCRLKVAMGDRRKTSVLLAKFQYREGMPKLRYGNHIQARLIDVSGANDPAWRKYLRDHQAMGFAIVDPRSINICRAPPVSARFAEKARESLSDSANNSIPGTRSALAKAMVIGDQSGLPVALSDDFKTAGLTHIMVVSGLNLSLTAGLLASCARFIFGSYTAGTLTGIGAAIFYGFMVGQQAPAWRAVIMLAAALTFMALGRPKEPILGLVYAILLMMTLNPFVIFQPGFQLSFGAVLALVYLPEYLQGILGLCESRFIRALLVPVSVQAVLAPLLAKLSGMFATYTIAANLLAVPIANVLTIACFVSWIFSLIHPLLGWISWHFAGLLASFIIEIAKFFAGLPGAGIRVSGAAGSCLRIAYIGAGAAVILRSRGMKRSFTAILTFLLMALAWFGHQSSWSKPDRFTVTFLDVGQGDATLIQTKSGKVILVDAGESGERIVDKLRQRNIATVDVFIISHPHADHIGGAQDVIEEMEVRDIVDSPQVEASPIYRRLLEQIEARKIPYRTVKAGKTFNIGEDTIIRVLGPSAQPIIGSDSEINDNSIISQIQYKGFTLLLPGDIQTEGEMELLRSGADVRADVLKVPHHGSAHSSSMEFLNAVQPDFAVISVGINNEFGHPAPSTLVRLRNNGIDSAQTDINGDVVIEVNDEGKYYIKTEKGELGSRE